MVLLKPCIIYELLNNIAILKREVVNKNYFGHCDEKSDVAPHEFVRLFLYSKDLVLEVDVSVVEMRCCTDFENFIRNIVNKLNPQKCLLALHYLFYYLIQVSKLEV